MIALMFLVYRKPSQNHDWHRVTRLTLHDSRRSGLRIDTADDEAVEADHHVTLTTDVGLGAVGLLVNERIALQKLVQRGLTAIETIHLIRCCELANRCVAIAQPSTPGSRSKLFRRVLLCTGRSSAS